jgi:uncharacterized protein YjbK
MPPVENEIKLDLQSEDNYRRLIAYFSEEKTEDTLENYFFDTDDRALSKSGWALRIRKESGGLRVTAKGPPGTAPAGLIVRPEMESFLSDDDIAGFIAGGIEAPQIPAEVADHLDKLIAGKTLRLITAFRTSRTTVQHRADDSELRFEIDRTVFADGTAEYELEVELADATQYDRAMTAIKSIFRRSGIPLKPQGESKLARALRRIPKGT